jgi:hypothetical protein
MQDLGAVDELQLSERHDAVLVEGRLEREVEAGEYLDGRQPRHDECGLDAAVLSQGKFLSQQSVDGLQRAHLAAFELSHSRVEDFDGTWHLEADQGALDAVDHGGNDLRMARH